MPKHHLLDPSAPNLEDWLVQHNQPKYRAKQIRSWLYERRAGSFADMSDLPKALRQLLDDEFTLFTSTIAKHSQSDDGTEKLLLELHDGGRIECVLLRDGLRFLRQRP